MTDNEIIKALECCVNDTCEECHYGEDECFADLNEENKMLKNTLDLINRQKAEIERLQKYNTNVAFKHYNDGKTEGIKEFWEKLKMKKQWDVDMPDYILVTDGDNLVKEMTENIKE